MLLEAGGGNRKEVQTIGRNAGERAKALIDQMLGDKAADFGGIGLHDRYAIHGYVAVNVNHGAVQRHNRLHQVVLMHQGRIWEQGPPGQMFGDPQTPELRQFLGSGVK